MQLNLYNNHSLYFLVEKSLDRPLAFRFQIGLFAATSDYLWKCFTVRSISEFGFLVRTEKIRPNAKDRPHSRISLSPPPNSETSTYGTSQLEVHDGIILLFVQCYLSLLVERESST